MTVKTEAILPEVMAEILRRRETALAHPELLEPWGDTTDRLRAQLDEIRRHKAQMAKFLSGKRRHRLGESS
jgi:hypothetical protein